MRLPHPAALVVALALLARTLPAPAAEQQPWPTCANFRTPHDAQITYHADQSDPLGLAASPPATTVPCGGNVAFGTPPLISCAVLDTRPNSQAALQLLFAYTRADGDPYGLDPDGNSIACDQRDHGQGATPQSVDLSQAATPLPGIGNVNETLSRATTGTPVTLPLATPASGAHAGSKSGPQFGSNAAQDGFGATLAHDATSGAPSGVEGAKGRVPSLTAPAAGTTDLGTSGSGTTSGAGKSSSSTSGTGKTGSGTAGGTSKRGTGTTGGTGKSGGGGTGGTGTPTTHGGTGHQPSAHTPSRHAKGHGKHHPSPAKGSHHHRGHHHSHQGNHHHHHSGHHTKH